MSQVEEVIVVSTLIDKGEKFRSLVVRFVNELPNFISEIKTAFHDNDLESLKGNLHKLKGVSGNYGYPQLSAMCAEMETLVSNENFVELEEFLPALDDHTAAIKKGV